MQDHQFDWLFYTTYYKDLSHIKSRKKALSHWNKFGINENRICLDRKKHIPQQFDWKFYTSSYSDLNHINNEHDALMHWLHYGKDEKRVCVATSQAPKNTPNYATIIIKDYIIKNKLEEYVHYYGFVSFDTYNELLNMCDIGIQIRVSNGGGLSGAVIDCLSVDKPIITTQDIIDSFNIKHNMLVGFDLKSYNDWISYHQPDGGYSDRLTVDICNVLMKFVHDKNLVTTANNDPISKIINGRIDNYTSELINILKLESHNKIAFVTPFPPDKSGVADYTYTTIKRLSEKIKYIDVFTDVNIADVDPVKKQCITNFFTIDSVEEMKSNYDKIIYIVGNSSFHTKIITYLNKLGGVCICHDESLVDLYAHLGRLPKNFCTDREKGYTSLCLDDIINAEPFIVHSKKLQEIINKQYNITPLYLPFCPYNILRKFSEEEIATVKEKYKINNDINIIISGSVYVFKCPFQIIKVVERMRSANIKCSAHFVGVY